MRFTSSFVALAIALAGTACYTMKPVTVNELETRRTARVWVTRADQSVVIINDAEMFRGKLVGFVEGKYQELPSADLQGLRVRKLAAGRTVSLIATSAFAFTVGVVLISGGGDETDGCVSGDEECDEMMLRVP